MKEQLTPQKAKQILEKAFLPIQCHVEYYDFFDNKALIRLIKEDGTPLYYLESKTEDIISPYIGVGLPTKIGLIRQFLKEQLQYQLLPWDSQVIKKALTEE